MKKRTPCARAFYAGANSATVDGYVAGFTPPALDGTPRGGVVPHAGWFFSGQTAARVFSTLAGCIPARTTFVFLGAVHQAPLARPAVDPCGAWETPFGDVMVDETLAREMLDGGLGLAADPDAHRGEHSIEVSLPFIRHFFPEAMFVPVACPPRPDAVAFGSALGALLTGRNVVVMASTDLTHHGEGYGYAPAGSNAPRVLAFMRANDGRIIDLVKEMNAHAIIAEAHAHLNACGSGALAAAVAAAHAMGARRGTLLEYRTSHDALPEDPIDRVVGYAGMVMA
jgi:MEMO1 family protein